MKRNKNIKDKGILNEPLIGIIPAAGKGTRVAPLPGSKELFPIGFSKIETTKDKRFYPKVVSQYLVDRMITAGVQNIYMVISEDKGDILRYYGSGKRFGAQIAYLVVDEMIGMPYTINTAFPLIKDTTVLFGMPDTIFQPSNAFNLLLNQHNRYSADLTLGLFATTQPWRFGMVGYDKEFRLTTCIDKPKKTNLKFMWGIACWGPRFSKFLSNEIQGTQYGKLNTREIVLGDYFRTAVQAGLNVRVYPFEKGEYVDIGSPEDLIKAVRREGNQEMEHKHNK